MKKILLLIFAVQLLFIPKSHSENNQEPSDTRYSGSVQVGYSLGVGKLGLDRINLHTVHGIKKGKYFSCGIGVGLDYYHSFGSNDYTDSEISMPLFLNLKGYTPISKRVAFFLSMDFGVSIGLTEGFADMKGLLTTPSIGFDIKVSEKKSISLSVSYNHQSWTESYLSISDDALSFKVGFHF